MHNHTRRYQYAVYMLIFLILAISIQAQEKMNKMTFTPTTDNICNNNICTMRIYSAQQYADSKGTLLNESESLKTCEFCDTIKPVIKEDSRYPIRIIDYNYTTITVCTRVTPVDYWKNVPLYTTDKDNNKLYQTVNVAYDLGQEHCYTIPFHKHETLKYGFNTTELTLNYTEITEDTYTYSSAATTEYGLCTYTTVHLTSSIKRHSFTQFDITDIPADATILDAELYLYMDYNGLDSDLEGFDISTVRIQGLWTEGGGSCAGSTCSWPELCYNTESTFAYDIENFAMVARQSSPTNNYFNVTEIVATDYEESHIETGIMLNTSNRLGTPGTSDFVAFTSSEGTNKPYLTITYYTEEAESTCECTSIQSGTTIDCTEGCTITGCDASGQDLRFSGSGTIHITGDITNHGDAEIINSCHVVCAGGCIG